MNTSKEMKDLNFLIQNSNFSSIETNESLKSEISEIVGKFFTKKIFIKNITEILIKLNTPQEEFNSKELINKKLTTLANTGGGYSIIGPSLYSWLLNNFRTKNSKEEFFAKIQYFLQENFDAKDHEMYFDVNKFNQKMRNSGLNSEEFIKTIISKHLDKLSLTGTTRVSEFKNFKVFLNHRLTPTSIRINTDAIRNVKQIEKIFEVSFQLYKKEDKADPNNSIVIKTILAACGQHGSRSTISRYFSRLLPNNAKKEIFAQTEKINSFFKSHIKRLYPSIDLNIFKKNRAEQGYYSKSSLKKLHIETKPIKQSVMPSNDNQNLLNAANSPSSLSSSFFASSPNSLSSYNEEINQFDFENPEPQVFRHPDNNFLKNRQHLFNFFQAEKSQIPLQSVQDLQENKSLTKNEGLTKNKPSTLEELMEEFNNTRCNY